MQLEVPAEELREIGGKHLRYEVRMLVCHARALLSYPGGIPRDDVMGFPNPAWDAVLEAWLVHLRVLDEFLHLTRPQKGNAIAKQWLKQWSGGFLCTDEIEAIERQVVHLNAQRRSPHEWDIEALTRRACERLVEFTDSVRDTRNDLWYETLREAREFADKFLDGSLGAEDCARTAVTFRR